MSELYQRASRWAEDGTRVHSYTGTAIHRIACSSELDESILTGCGRQWGTGELFQVDERIDAEQLKSQLGLSPCTRCYPNGLS